MASGNVSELTQIIDTCATGKIDKDSLIKLCEIQGKPLNELLQGTGKIADLRKNKNLRGLDIDDILSSSPAKIRQMGLTKRQLNPIKKAVQEKRDLGGRRGGGNS